MTRLARLCGGVATVDDKEEPGGRGGTASIRFRSRRSFQASQSLKQQFSDLPLQPHVVPRTADALVNLHGRSLTCSSSPPSVELFVRRPGSALTIGEDHDAAAVVVQPPPPPPPPASRALSAPPPPQQQQQPQPQQHAGPRLLRWTTSRRLLDLRLQTEQAASAKQLEPDDLDEEQRLLRRLERLGLDVLVAEGDGNCLFRSVSQQLTGSQQDHAALRALAVQHIRGHPEDFEAWLGEDLEAYCLAMDLDGTWGDELTLRALSDALGMVVHVVTSCQHHWWLQYVPQARDPDTPEVFLTYIAPLHYNSVQRQPPSGLARALAGSFKRAAGAATGAAAARVAPAAP